MVWTEFNRLRIKSVVGLFNTVSTFISHASRRASGSGNQLQACEGLCCMKILSIIIIIIIYVLTSKYVWIERTHTFTNGVPKRRTVRVLLQKGIAQLAPYTKWPVGHMLSWLYVDRHEDSVRIFFPLITWNKQNKWKRRDALGIARRICEGHRPRGHHNSEDKVTAIYINICSY